MSNNISDNYNYDDTPEYKEYYIRLDESIANILMTILKISSIMVQKDAKDENRDVMMNDIRAEFNSGINAIIYKLIDESKGVLQRYMDDCNKLYHENDKLK